ncbi:hypothetical protein G3N56_16085 [Desulfovibrio sulfodismutans]|uniref:Uncharacterized protein n=1 Tax=Desulfolutivibrio sulfodismutans TaxID=63561 RepID=A0A7K3NR29_9BACT|nr:hypothetical protein [Desulfolutivibrio sulfodismutans]NDY58253.1 hypothetical protein [Desulfolutivibrio sulfodismutans]QLA13075.1 hypothetical protein GD606_12765 [Desulfolutivibrio sulfodismutans DSM 3696]
MTRPLRLGKDPLGRLDSPADGHLSAPGPGGSALDRILADSGNPSAAPEPQCPPQSGSAGRESDAVARTLEFLQDMIDGSETTLPCPPCITVDTESDLTDLPMRQAYLLGHALRLILEMGKDAPRSGPAATPLRIHLHSRLSGRLELSVTDGGDFFPANLSLFEGPHPDVRELADFVSRRGGSVLVTRGRATQVSVVVWGRQAATSTICAAE